MKQKQLPVRANSGMSCPNQELISLGTEIPSLTGHDSVQPFVIEHALSSG